MNSKFKICNCNGTMPLGPAEGEQLGALLGVESLPVAGALCRRDLGEFRDALGGHDSLIVGCTQEQALFEETARTQQHPVPIRFVNLRETANWGNQRKQALPKTAALLADAALPASDPVASVRYVSQGKTLIIGDADQALAWAERLAGSLPVSVLLTNGSARTRLPLERRYTVYSGSDVRIDGWLGAFDVTWRQADPVDLDVCVRCGACVDACPEQAITDHFQVDAEKCRAHGDCIDACGAIGAIDFARTQTKREGRFDLILDLSPAPLIDRHQPPQGYFRTGIESASQQDLGLRLMHLVGEFEKPKYFTYKARLCAHSRNRQIGCNACIEVCSANAIESAGDRIQVNSHLCVGCGACTTVCPSGALGFAYPTAAHTGRRIQTVLATYTDAGGRQPVILLHSEHKGRALIDQLGRLARNSPARQGVPARVIPLALPHTASVGIDVWLAAVAWGCAGIAVLVTDEEAPQYVDALAEQMTIAQTVLSGLGYGGTHLQLIRAAAPDTLDAALQNAPAGVVPNPVATFHVAADKRNSLDMALAHLHRHAPMPVPQVPLPSGSPFGAVAIDTAACTLCMACVGACPASALSDSTDAPQLRFIEKNCVQCGLCETTCPEDAISLVPRLAFGDQVKSAVVLNETQPFLCIRCHKPFGTLRMIESMLAKLDQHGAFRGNLDRLKMCGDCRVVDLMSSKREATVFDLKRPGAANNT